MEEEKNKANLSSRVPASKSVAHLDCTTAEEFHKRPLTWILSGCGDPPEQRHCPSSLQQLVVTGAWVGRGMREWGVPGRSLVLSWLQ